MKKIVIAFATVCILQVNMAYALEAITGKVTHLQPTTLPTHVSFIMDTGNTTCPAGTWLWWLNRTDENHKAVYATLLAAVLGNKKVSFYINDGDTNCHGQFLHILDDE